MRSLNLCFELGMRGRTAEASPKMSGATFRLLGRAALSITLITLFILFPSTSLLAFTFFTAFSLP